MTNTRTNKNTKVVTIGDIEFYVKDYNDYISFDELLKMLPRDLAKKMLLNAMVNYELVDAYLDFKMYNYKKLRKYQLEPIQYSFIDLFGGMGFDPAEIKALCDDNDPTFKYLLKNYYDPSYDIYGEKEWGAENWMTKHYDKIN